MDRFSVVMAGGGVAAIEGVLRLRRLAGDAVDATLLAPNEEFTLRALSVREPFAMGHAQRHAVRRVARDANAEWVQDTLDWVDLDRQVVHASGGREIGFDALLIATGGRMTPVLDHATTYRDQEADALVSGIIQDVEEGYSKRVAFVAPAGPRWMLPLYELALMTAERARSSGMADVQINLVTPEAAPLASFGSLASEAVGRLLAESGIDLRTSATATVPRQGRLAIDPEGIELAIDRVVAMPQISGPGIRGLPGAGAHGFIPIDDRCRVADAGGHVFAAGDATDFPVKHGGLSAAQADTAAAEIARLAGADVETGPFEPVIHGKLLTGARPLYMSARLIGGSSVESQVSDEPLWDSDAKVVAEELTTYLAERA